MHARIDRSQAADPDQLKSLLLSDPSIIEPGLRLLDAGLDAGPSGRIDLVAADPSGSIVIASIAGDCPDDALPHLIDQYGWALDQRALLERLYAGSGVRGGRPIRCVLVASTLTPAILRRLALLRFDVTAYLALMVSVRGETAVVVEPADAIFGSARGRGRHPENRQDDAGAAVSIGRARETRTRGLESAPGSGPHHDDDVTVWPDGNPLLESPGDLRGLVHPAAGTAAAGDADDGPVPAEATEEIESAQTLQTLTAEELEEFARFDRMRRDRGGEAD